MGIALRGVSAWLGAFCYLTKLNPSKIMNTTTSPQSAQDAERAGRAYAGTGLRRHRIFLISRAPAVYDGAPK
jgi:hypothetical protein